MSISSQESFVASYDSKRIQCRFLTRSDSSSPPHSNTCLAIVAHPLGRLGGSWDDHVVAAVSEALLENGYDVVNFNSRGVGRSEGSASFTGEPESKDYQCIINHFSSLYPDYSKLDLVIAGYSAGSLYASVSLPPTPPPHRTRYILISYPYSVLWALTALHSSRYTSRLEELVSQPTSEALIVYGTQDQFTAVGKYRSWGEGLEGLGRIGEGGRGKARFVEVEGADHFWGSKRNELKAVIQGWL